VTQLFPGTYVHIGGDEAPKKVWEESADVKKIMAKNKITEVEKVQGWFNARIEKFLMSKGKKLIGWDEILEGGITPASTVMSWRGEKGGIEAARHGNDVVMSPHDYVYLDYGQNPQPYHPLEPLMICCYLPLERIYSYNPLPESLTPEMQKHILGVQANLWTEYIPTSAKAEYALFPRLLGLSEIGWTDPAKKNYEKFVQRVSAQFPILDMKNVNYRIPEPGGLTEKEIIKNETHATITLTSIVPNAQIVYTLDGHVPDETAKIYEQAIIIPLGRSIKVRAVTIAPNHRKSAPVEIVVN
jgi:hexosaminidase